MMQCGEEVENDGSDAGIPGSLVEALEIVQEVGSTSEALKALAVAGGSGEAALDAAHRPEEPLGAGAVEGLFRGLDADGSLLVDGSDGAIAVVSGELA